jgi:hypothetical protein
LLEILESQVSAGNVELYSKCEWNNGTINGVID